MAQFARPNSTISAGGWTATGAASLQAATNEVSANDDTSYMTRTGTGTAELGLSSVTDPLSSSGHIVRWRAKQQTGSGAQERLEVALYQGATLIATSGTLSLTRGSYVSFSMTLTAGQADAITNYADLRLRFLPTQGASEVMRVTWAELEVPDASTPISQTDTNTAVVEAAALSVDVTVAETGVGTEGTTKDAESTSAETGTGTDEVSLTVTLEAAETGTGVDGIAGGPSVGFKSLLGFWVGGISVADVPPGGYISHMAFWMGGAGIALQTDVPTTDTGSGTDAFSMSAEIPVPETGTGLDVGSAAVGIAAAETGAGVEGSTLSVNLTLAEAWAGLDNMSVVYESAPPEFAEYVYLTESRLELDPDDNRLAIDFEGKRLP